MIVTLHVHGCQPGVKNKFIRVIRNYEREKIMRR